MAQPEKIVIFNRKIHHDYEILSDYIAGIQLVGPEVKSIRLSNVSIKEAHCIFIGHELFVKGMHIAPYKEGTYNNVDPLRDRKLLLTKKELVKLSKAVQTKGITIVPIKLFINDRGKIKILIGLAKGKKVYEKREDLKLKDLKRESKFKIN